MKRPAFLFLLSQPLLLAATGAALATDSYPLTLDNCGAPVTLDAPAERIFMVNADDVPLLYTLDALDRVVARTSEPLEGVYPDAVYDQLAAIPLVSSETNATGGSVISLEAIIDSDPDLVLAPQNAVDRELLAAAGIATYSPPAYCANGADGPQGTASFERVYDQLEEYGAMLGISDRAEEEINALQGQVDALAELNPESRGSAVALYVSQGGAVLSPYGAFSMITPIFEAAGLTNVYAQTQERVFDVGAEELLGKDPETIVLLYSSGTPEALVETFTSIPSVQGLTAVQKGRVVALQFPFTDPPTPLSIAGAQVLAEKLDALP